MDTGDGAQSCGVNSNPVSLKITPVWSFPFFYVCSHLCSHLVTIAISFFIDLVGCHKQLVYWHVIGMGTAPEVHSIFLEGHTFLVRNHRQASLEISPITFLTVQTILTDLGQFLLFCHISSHQHGNICGCPKQVEEKSRSNLPLMFVVGFAFG